MAENPIADQVRAIVADPNWLPYKVRDEGQSLELIHLSRGQLRDLFFLDKRSHPDRWDKISGDAPSVQIPVTAILDGAGKVTSGDCHYIFHSAFCCSTLMSRALDIEGVACVLREPRPLHELVVKMPGSHLTDQQRTALDLVLELMQRPRLAGEKTIIKPANLANPLIDHILQRQPNARALFMYCSLPGFLLAIARRRRWSWSRNLAAFYRKHLEFETQQTRDLLLLTDMQMAAFLWLQHQAQFARLARDLPAWRIATLRADTFVARPADALAAAARLFELPLSEDEAAAIAGGPIFQRHSKSSGASFDESAQKRNDALLKLAFGPEIEHAIEWGEAVAAEAGIPLELQAPLIGE